MCSSPFWAICTLLLSAENAFCLLLSDGSVPHCPENFAETAQFCYTFSEKSHFPPPCPYADVLDFASYEDLIVEEDAGPVWMPVKRDGVFQWTEASSLYKTVWGKNLTISSNLTKKDCVLFYNRSYTEFVSCQEEHSALCVYRKIGLTDNQLCRTENSCVEKDFHRRNQCFCLEKSEETASPKAEFLKIYQNHLYANLTDEVCAFGLEKTPEGTYVWANSQQMVNYSLWSSLVLFDNSHKYGAITTNGWILTEFPLPCTLIEKEIQEIEPSLILFYESLRKVFVLEVTAPKFLKLLESGTFVYCFTDVHPTELVYRYPTLNATLYNEDAVLFEFWPLEYGPGNYWCEAFKYVGLDVITSNNVFLRTPKLQEFVAVLGAEYSVNLTEVLLNIDTDYMPRITKLIDMDDRVGVNVHFTPKYQTNNGSLDYQLLKNFIEQYVAEYGVEIMDFLSADFCEPSLDRLSWPRTEIGNRVASEEYCLFPNGSRLYRSCGGSFEDGARWSPVEIDCEVLSSSDLSKTTQALTTTYDLENLDGICNISKSYSHLGSLDVYLIGNFFEHFDPFQLQANFEIFVQILDNLLLVDANILIESQVKARATDSFLCTIDRVLSSPLRDFNFSGNLRLVTSDIESVIGVTDQEKVLRGNFTLEDIQTIEGLEVGLSLSPALRSQFSNNDKISFVLYSRDGFFGESEPKNLSQIVGVYFSKKLTNFEGPLRILHRLDVDTGMEAPCFLWKYRCGVTAGSWEAVGSSRRMGSFQVCEFWSAGSFALLLKRKNFTDSLTAELRKTIENDFSVSDKIQRLLEMSQTYEEFAPSDVVLAAQILQGVADSRQIDLYNLALIINNLIKIDKNVLLRSQMQYTATDILISSVNRIIQASQSTEPRFIKVTDNFAMFSSYVLQAVVAGLLVLNINNTIQVNILESEVRIEDLIEMEYFDCAIILSEEIRRLIYGGSKVVITVYFRDTFFNSNSSLYHSEGKIFGILLPEMEVYPGPISVLYKTSDSSAKKCAHWSYNVSGNTSGYWKQDGDGRTISSVVQCNYWKSAHLGLLQLVNGENKPVASPIFILSMISLAFSLTGFNGIILTAVLFKKWRQDTGNQILLNFVLAVMVQITSYHIATVQHPEAHVYCVVYGALRHYSVIAQFCWMFVIAVLQFRKFVIVFGKTPTHLLLKSCLIGWGLPVVPVFPVLVTGQYTYRDAATGICYLEGLPLALGVWLPVGVIHTFNTVIFAHIVCSVCHTAVGSKEVLHQWKIAVLLFFMLDLNWTFALLENLRCGVLFAYLFSITSNSQGAVIFLYFIIFNKKTRKMYSKLFKGLFRVD